MSSNRFIRWGVESAYGTAVTPSVYWDIASESLKLKIDTRTIQPARSHSATRQLQTRRSVAGGIDIYSNYTALGKVLKQVISAPVTSTLAAGAYQHVFTPSGQYVPSSLTVDVARDIALHRYTGVGFTAARLSMSTADRHFGLSLDCIGKDESDAGALPSPAESVFLKPAQIGDDAAASKFSVVVDDGSTSWTANLDTLDFQFRWNRRLREVDRSFTPSGLIAGGIIGASAKLKWLYETDTEFLLNAYRNRTSVSVTFTMKGAVLSKGPTRYETLLIEFPICKVMGEPPQVRTSGFGNLDFAIDGAALYSDAGGYGPFRVTLTSSASSY